MLPPNFIKKAVISDTLPESIERITQLVSQEKDKLSALKSAYNLVSEKFPGYRLGVFYNFWIIYYKDLHKLMKYNYLFCTQVNYILRNVLVKSGWYKDEDIQIKWTLISYIIPHQYLKIKIKDNKYISVDPWARRLGIKFGNYLYSFHT